MPVLSLNTHLDNLRLWRKKAVLWLTRLMGFLCLPVLSLNTHMRNLRLCGWWGRRYWIWGVMKVVMLDSAVLGVLGCIMDVLGRLACKTVGRVQLRK